MEDQLKVRAGGFSKWAQLSLTHHDLENSQMIIFRVHLKVILGFKQRYDVMIFKNCCSAENSLEGGK